MSQRFSEKDFEYCMNGQIFAYVDTFGSSYDYKPEMQPNPSLSDVFPTQYLLGETSIIFHSEICIVRFPMENIVRSNNIYILGHRL